MSITKARTVQYPVVVTVEFGYADTNGNTTDAAEIIASLPDGAEVVGGSVVVDTAWVGPVTATIDIGDAGQADRYTASPIDLKTAGRTALTLTGFKTVGASDLLATIADATEDATAGAARISIEYIRHGKANEVQV